MLDKIPIKGIKSIFGCNLKKMWKLQQLLKFLQGSVCSSSRCWFIASGVSVFHSSLLFQLFSSLTGALGVAVERLALLLFSCYAVYEVHT